VYPFDAKGVKSSGEVRRDGIPGFALTSSGQPWLPLAPGNTRKDVCGRQEDKNRLISHVDKNETYVILKLS
jgi:hypothetical protein